MRKLAPPLLYEETDPEQVKTLAGIAEAVRGHLLEHDKQAIGKFLLQPVVPPQRDANGASYPRTFKPQ